MLEEQPLAKLVQWQTSSKLLHHKYTIYIDIIISRLCEVKVEVKVKVVVLSYSAVVSAVVACSVRVKWHRC